jgi:hypothetical protein
MGLPLTEGRRLYPRAAMKINSRLSAPAGYLSQPPKGVLHGEVGAGQRPPQFHVAHGWARGLRLPEPRGHVPGAPSSARAEPGMGLSSGESGGG